MPSESLLMVSHIKVILVSIPEVLACGQMILVTPWPYNSIPEAAVAHCLCWTSSCRRPHMGVTCSPGLSLYLRLFLLT